MFMTHCKYETQQLHYTLQFQIIISTFCYSGKYLLTPIGGLRINFAFLDAIASLGLPMSVNHRPFANFVIDIRSNRSDEQSSQIHSQVK